MNEWMNREKKDKKCRSGRRWLNDSVLIVSQIILPSSGASYNHGRQSFLPECDLSQIDPHHRVDRCPFSVRILRP